MGLQVRIPFFFEWIVEFRRSSLYNCQFMFVLIPPHCLAGTGKSHSLFGTDEQPGAIALAAHYLLSNVSSKNDDNDNTNDDASTTLLVLRVSSYEVDGKTCRDLLGNHEPLTVRIDEHGMAQLRHVDGSGPLTRQVVSTTDEFQSLQSTLQTSRRVGRSTVHVASSRTHAIVDFEIVDANVIRLEQTIEEKHAAYIAISNAKDDALMVQIEEAYKRDGAGAVVNGVPLGDLVRQHGLPSEEALQALRDARTALTEYIQQSSHKALLGSFSFIDMAGNDWEQATTMQTSQAKKEHAEINTSLLAVKECFRAMQQQKTHVPYRRSHLTKILKRHLDSHSSNCVMLTTIYPSCGSSNDNGDDKEVRLKQTMNTLLYASSIATRSKVR